ncbi:hypothetical protein JCM10213v2_000599 [Rhodosporidiobolus nylandii]
MASEHSDTPSNDAPAPAHAAGDAAGRSDASSATTRHKRPRAAVDPGTPRGDDSEGKALGMTPLAKKGRTEDDPTREVDGGSDNERATPPPSGEASSRPATPAQSGNVPSVPGTEGKDTRKLRERVAATKLAGQEQDTPEKRQDTEIADVAAEVSGSAAKLGDEQDKKDEKDVEIAEVAAEVGQSAAKVDTAQASAAGAGEEVKMASSAQDKSAAETAAEVGESAAEVQKEDEEKADTAAEVADAAKQAPEPTPSSTPKPATAAQPTFASYSSTTSPFAAFSSAASPLAAVGSAPAQPTSKATGLAPFEGKPAPPSGAAREPVSATSTSKPFSASPFLSSSIAPAAPPTPSTSSSKPAVAEVPATPLSFTKSAPTTNLAAASPFSAFASTSGFASASKPAAAAGSSAFSAFSAAPSAFSAVPPTPLKASGKSALDEAKDSPAPSPAAGGEGEAEEGDKKPVFTEQERFTGEEDEETVHQVRCKVFVMEDGNWKERGTGPLRVNQKGKKAAAEGEEKGSARLVMRADATHRLLLNAPLFREFSIEVSNEKYVRFTVLQGTEPVSYMLRTGNPAAAQNLVQAVRDKVATL